MPLVATRRASRILRFWPFLPGAPWGFCYRSRSYCTKTRIDFPLSYCSVCWAICITLTQPLSKLWNMEVVCAESEGSPGWSTRARFSRWTTRGSFVLMNGSTGIATWHGRLTTASTWWTTQHLRRGTTTVVCIQSNSEWMIHHYTITLLHHWFGSRDEVDKTWSHIFHLRILHLPTTYSLLAVTHIHDVTGRVGGRHEVECIQGCCGSISCKQCKHKCGNFSCRWQPQPLGIVLDWVWNQIVGGI